MVNIPEKLEKQLIQETKKYLKILENAKSRDVNESDTVTIIKDMLQDVFGYDKYLEVTGEHLIRGTYCDLAVKDLSDNKIRYLIECKSINTDLCDKNIKQAVDYGANAGVDWIVLSNGISWTVYKIIFEKPVSFEVVFELDFLSDIKDKKFIEKLFLLSKKGISKSAIESFHEEKQIINKYTIGALIQTNIVTSIIRKELRKLSKGLLVDSKIIEDIIRNEVIKREIIENDKTKHSLSKLKRTSKKTSTIKTNDINTKDNKEETETKSEEAFTDTPIT